MPAILTAISLISTVLSAIGGLKGASVTVAHIQPIVTAVGNVATAIATSAPITNVSSGVAAVGSALTALQSSGVVEGQDATILASVTADIAKYHTQVSNYLAGEAVVIDSAFSFEGDAGYLVAVSKTGSAATALGLA